MLKNLLRLAALIALLAGYASAQCTPGNLAVVVNKANSTDSLSMAQLRRLMIGDVRAWPDGKPVVLISRDSSSPVFQCALAAVVRLSVAEFHRYVMSAEFRGDEPMSIQTVGSDSNASKMIAGAPGGLAIMEVSSIPSLGPSLKVLRINGKAPGEAGYPL